VEDVDALGLALEALGDDAGAVTNYQKAIALNEARKGKFVSAHVNLSAYYNRTSDPGKALEYADKALEVDPSLTGPGFKKGKADEGQGRLNDAVDAVNRAISFNPRLPPIITCWPASTAASERWTTAEKRWTHLTASTRKQTSSRSCDEAQTILAESAPAGGEHE